MVFYLKYSIGIPCIFHKITGLYCPGCGLTRASISILQLDFYQALRYNMLSFFIIPFLIFGLINEFILKNKIKIPKVILILFIVLLVGFGIARNIPYFSYLAPTEMNSANYHELN